MSKFRVVFNSVLYCTGSILFLIGSVFYYPFANPGPHLDGFTIGAVLYLIGASLFFIAAVIDWIAVQRRRPDLRLDMSLVQMAASVQYVSGCIYYIPVLHSPDIGSYLFISGSVFFVVHAAADVRRNMAAANGSVVIPVQIAIHNAAGAFLFLIGAVLFLDINNDHDLTVATTVFVGGSVLFTISSVLFALDLYRSEWPAETTRPGP